MNKVKYITYTDNSGQFSSIMFPAYIEHVKMANVMNAQKVRGAGFCYIDSSNNFKCYGRSVSLNIDSIPDQDAMKLSIDYKELIS